jgi:Calcineurin-like phosphoesterase
MQPKFEALIVYWNLRKYCVFALLGMLLMVSQAVLAQAQLSDRTIKPIDSSKAFTVFISDLHLGVGKTSQHVQSKHWTEGEWDPYEDFRWTDEFAAFLNALRKYSDTGPLELIVLGDFVELWQSPDAESCPEIKGKKNLGCNAVAALDRLQRVIGAHQADLKLLRDFANYKDNRVTIVPGNHDAALVFPGLSDILLKAIGSEPGRVRFAAEGYWLSSDNLIFAEHGHDMVGEVNKFTNLPSSCLDGSEQVIGCDKKDAYLMRTWGEQFVQGFYNKYERMYPVVDNFKTEVQGVTYALSLASPEEIEAALKGGAKFLLLGQSVAQLGALLSNETSGMPVWDVAKIKAEKDDRFLADLFIDADFTRTFFAKSASGKKDILQSLENDEILYICDVKYALSKNGRKVELCTSDSNLSSIAIGGAKQILGETRFWQRHFLNRQAEIIRLTSQQALGQFQVFVYGHTHNAGNMGPVPVKGEWSVHLLNSGAWQRTISSEQHNRLMKARQDSNNPNKAVQVEDLPPCYGVVVVPPYSVTRRPQAAQRYWVSERSVDGKVLPKGNFSAQCPY